MSMGERLAREALEQLAAQDVTHAAAQRVDKAVDDVLGTEFSLPQRADLPTFEELGMMPLLPRTFRNLANRDRVIE